MLTSRNTLALRAKALHQPSQCQCRYLSALAETGYSTNSSINSNSNSMNGHSVIQGINWEKSQLYLPGAVLVQGICFDVIHHIRLK